MNRDDSFQIMLIICLIIINFIMFLYIFLPPVEFTSIYKWCNDNKLTKMTDIETLNYYRFIVDDNGTQKVVTVNVDRLGVHESFRYNAEQK